LGGDVPVNIKCVFEESYLHSE